ncbi:MAG: hypothetical protein R3354_03060 [Thiohalomonadales bacterium]|nr:hypothetical protein [Thiohalomonadales bacterium]
MKIIVSFIFVATSLVVGSNPIKAECAADLYGEMICGMGKCERDQYGSVFCSRFNNGGAVRDGYGNVYCGIGDCARDQYGKVYCSKVVGGGAARDRYGEIKCAGGCEPGRVDYCLPGEE